MDRLKISVKAQDGSLTVFQVKPSMKMSRIFDAFAQRYKLDKRALGFLLDGERIKDDDTVKSLDLQEDDQIDCMLEQNGG